MENYATKSVIRLAHYLISDDLINTSMSIAIEIIYFFKLSQPHDKSSRCDAKQSITVFQSSYNF